MMKAVSVMVCICMTLEIKDDVGELISTIQIDQNDSKKTVIRASGHPQKHSLFHDSTSERLERQEKLLNDIFEHKIDKKTLTSIQQVDLRSMVEPFRGKRAIDDSCIDYRTVDDFAVFEKISEGLMRIVFEEALENGFFGLLGDNISNMNISAIKPPTQAIVARTKAEDIPINIFDEPIPQQIETRREVLQAKLVPEKKVWLADIESRIIPNDQLRVLVVDDTENDRMVICSNVLNEYSNAYIDEAENGQEAFYLVQEAYLNGWRYDLVFMDMNMTGYDGPVGISMIRGFEKRNKISNKTNICAVSGDDFEDTQGVDAANVLTILKKPISSELIKMILRRVQSQG